MFPFRRVKLIRRFADDRCGGVAVIFGLGLIPIFGLIGSAIDYSAASNARAQLQSSADAAALALAHQARTLPPAQLQAQVATEFGAVYQPTSNTALNSVTATFANGTVVVQARANVGTAFMGLFGVPTLAIAATSSATFNVKKIELALVLDNTGSMADANKMVELKKAVNNLIDKLEATSTTAGDIKASIVPFNTEVDIGTAYASAPWLTWNVTLENPNMSTSQRTPPTLATWTGCISDRYQPYDTVSDPSTGGQSSYVASKCHYAGLAPMSTLTSDLERVRATTNSMQPTGATNVTVGFTAGLATLRPDSPFGGASSNASDVVKFLVLLTDGNNTQNRWGGTGMDGNPYAFEIDQRLNAACLTARSSLAVRVITVRVMDGNAGLLRGCASDPGMYYDVQDAAQLQPVFQSILSTITAIRLAS